MTIYDALKKDHEKVKQLLNQLVMSEGSPAEERSDLIAQIRDELIPHARAEESVFYNSLRSLDQAKDIVMHGYGEHIEAETLLRTLQAKDKVDMEWKSTAAKLRTAVTHHIDEEETKIFNVAKQLFTNQEATMMAEAFEALKPEIKEEGLMQTSIELITNLMPQRFVPALKSINLDARI